LLITINRFCSIFLFTNLRVIIRQSFQ
jgi:hypothetical protein